MLAARMRLIPLILVAAILLGGCASPSKQSAPDVLTTFYPLTFLAQEIAGDAIRVESIVPSGVEPHDYEPTPDDIKKVHDAKLLIIQGAGFEGWLETARTQAPEARIVTATSGLDLRANADEAEADEIPQDPHAWLDPILYGEMAKNVERALADAYPNHADAFATRLADLTANLTQLDRAFEAGLATCEVRVVITNHAAFGYMAARYNFTMIGLSGLDPESEPTPEAIREAIDAARQHNVTVIFFEELVSPRVAEAVAREVGATTRVLSPVEGIPEDEIAQGRSYFSVMRENIDALRAGMRCS